MYQQYVKLQHWNIRHFCSIRRGSKILLTLTSLPDHLGVTGNKSMSRGYTPRIWKMFTRAPIWDWAAAIRCPLPEGQTVLDLGSRAACEFMPGSCCPGISGVRS